MSPLHSPERLIINQLIDHNIFTSTQTSQTTQVTREAIQALKRPATQQRIGTFFDNLVGRRPGNYQENLVLLLGQQRLSATTVHVLLATFKAIINLPELQNQSRDRVVLTDTVVRQVNSEVTELDDKTILRQINAIFVDQLGLLVLDRPETPTEEQAAEVQDFWDVSPDFNYVAQCLVDQLLTTTQTMKLTPVQQLNRLLLTQRFISRSRNPQLWPTLMANRVAIAAQWAQLQRFDLEVGDDYALLLDTQRQPSGAKPFIVAIAVAQRLGIGVQKDELAELVKKVLTTVVPVENVTTTLVKQALFEFGLVTERAGFISPTPLVARFTVKAEEEAAYDAK